MRRLAKCCLTTGEVCSLFFYSDSYTLKQPRRAVVDSFTVKTNQPQPRRLLSYSTLYDVDNTNTTSRE